MGRAVGVVVLAMLTGAAPAKAASPRVTISASATAGAAPLTVTFEAQGDAASYHWQLGNGETAEGPTASATYGPGLWTVTVTATAAGGETAQASVTVRSVAITLLPAAEGRYGKAAIFRGTVVPALAAEPVALYVGGRHVATTLAEVDGTFRLRLRRVRTPGPYEARTPVAASAPVALSVHPVLRAAFVGTGAVGGRLALAARVRPAAAGTLSIRLYRDGRLVRNAGGRAAARLVVATDRPAGYRAVVGVEPAQGWLSAARTARTRVCARGSRDGHGDGLTFRSYAGSGYQFQPLLSFAALNSKVSHRRWCAARRLASALVARAVRSGNAAYWEYGFSFEGGPVPWRSGFAQAVAAQALARAGALLQDPALSAAAAAAFRGLRGPLLMRLAGGAWVREYGFTNEVILNAQLQSIISLDSYAAVADSAPGRRLAQELAVAARRLLPRFDLGCWARYELGGGPASRHYQTYHVELLRRLAATRPEPIWRRTYLRWRRCLRGHGSKEALAQGCPACLRVGRVIVRDVMSPSPLTVDATATLTEAASQMHARGVGAALVLNGELLSGILTERDVLRAVATGEVEGTKVGAWMTHDPETVGPEERPGHAAAIMLQGGFRHLPVLEDTTPIGIVSIRDLMRLAIDDVSGTTA